MHFGYFSYTVVSFTIEESNLIFNKKRKLNSQTIFFLKLFMFIEIVTGSAIPNVQSNGSFKNATHAAEIENATHSTEPHVLVALNTELTPKLDPVAISIIPSNIIEKSETSPLQRPKRIHLFRPLFVYRQQEIKKQRVSDRSDRRKYKQRNLYYKANAVHPSRNLDPIDRYPYENRRSGAQHSRQDDAAYGNRFVNENQRYHSEQTQTNYDNNRGPQYDSRTNNDYNEYSDRSRYRNNHYYDDGGSSATEQNYNYRYRPSPPIQFYDF